MLRYFTIMVCFLFCRCENSSWNQDKRQMAAKDEIMARLPGTPKDFDITGFGEDTVSEGRWYGRSGVIQYHLDFSYKDSSGTIQQRTGRVLFTPDGKSVLEVVIAGNR